MDENMDVLMEEEASVEEVPAAEEPVGHQLRDEDAMDFIRQYPGLDPKTIPLSVWEAVKKGDSLVNAYGRHEMQQLRADNQRLQQQLGVFNRNEMNRQRSLGSMRSSGKAKVVDDFLMGFNQE